MIFERNGVLVWDDALEHRQAVLTSDSLGILRRVKECGDSISLHTLPQESRLEFQRLVECGVLVEINSSRFSIEQDALARWAGVPTLARIFHYSSRTLDTDPVMTGEETDSALVDLTRRQPPPTRFRDAGLQRLRLDETFEYEGYYRPFGEVLEQRRTIRAFRQHTLSRDALSGILSAAARLSRNRQRTNNDLTYENYFRSAPSGGARASTELFVHARRIASVPRGNYRYLPDGHALEYVSEASSDDVIAEAMSGQTWFLDCAALIVVAVSLEGSFWKYPARRSYRSVLLDAGHLNQTIYLAATAARIGVGTTAAQRDELWEREMGVSAATHVVALVTGIGPRSTDDPYMAALPRTDST